MSIHFHQSTNLYELQIIIKRSNKPTLHKLLLALLERHLDRLEHLPERVSERNSAIKDFKVVRSSIFSLSISAFPLSCSGKASNVKKED